MCFIGNRGTFPRGYKAVVQDISFLYHMTYVVVCMLGLFVHEFFYSFLVRASSCLSPFRHLIMCVPQLIGAKSLKSRHSQKHSRSRSDVCDLLPAPCVIIQNRFQGNTRAMT